MNSDRIKKSGGFQNTNQKEKAVSEYLWQDGRILFCYIPKRSQ
jgi:hypothetical protein